MRASTTSKKLGLFQWIVNVSTIIALVLQCVHIPDPWANYVPYLAYAVIGSSIVSIIIHIVTRRKSTYKRDALVEMTKNRMINSIGKVVMFGGDLSWADDYAKTITTITNNSQEVEIFFPLEKIGNAKRSVIDRFDKSVVTLKKAGAVIYCSEKDYHLRCTLIDVNPGQENRDLCVISSKRTRRDASNQKNNTYITIMLDYKNDEDRMMCDSFYRNYCLMKELSSEY